MIRARNVARPRRNLTPCGRAVSRGRLSGFTTPPHARTRSGGHAAAVLIAGLIAIAGLTLPAIASAAPKYDVELTRSPLVVPKTDTAVEYAATIRNVGTAAVGEELTCAANTWTPASGVNAPTFSFQWLSDGVAASGSSTTPTATTSAYTIHPDDAGRSVQCRVTGTNPVAVTTAVTAPTLVGSIPATRPPAMDNSRVGASRPTIAGTGTFATKRVCSPPTNWSGSPSWGFQWLRNGAPISGATSNEYQPVDAEDTGKVLQCMVTGSNAGGAAVGISINNAVGTVTNPPANAAAPLITSSATANASAAPALEFEFELPLGEDTYLANVSLAPTNWNCTRRFADGDEPAAVTCAYTNATVRGWGEVLPSPIAEMLVSLDAATPGPALFTATTTGGGSIDPTVVVDSLTFAPPVPFGITPGTFEAMARDSAGDPYEQAGGHPVSAGAVFGLNTRRVAALYPGSLGPSRAIVPVETVRDIKTDLPAGFLGNPEAIPQLCAEVEEIRLNKPSSPQPNCPVESIVGAAEVYAKDESGTFDPEVSNFPDNPVAGGRFPVYAVKPARGFPAQFAFKVSGVDVLFTLSGRLRPGDGYAVSVDAPRSPSFPELLGARATLCGFGVKVINEGGEFRTDGCKQPSDPGAFEKPFLANTTKCAGGTPVTNLHLDSWLNPAASFADGTPDLSDPNWKSASAVAPPVTGCENVPFEPEVDLDPTSNRADSPTGLEVELTVPSGGFESPEGISQAHLKKTTVTLPEGMTVNPSAGDGLAACTSAQISLGTNNPVKCPDASKVGTAEVVTPLLEEKLTGDVYIAKQVDNPFNSLLALYIVVESKERGILVKIPGKVDADPQTGRLVSTFDDNPQAPFSSLKLRFRGGERAPLVNPPSCGSYDIVAEMTPWSAADPDNPTPAETVTETSTFEVTSGPGGGPCPADAFDPRFNAGSVNPVAGETSPFVLRLHREDGTRRFTGLEVSPPLGLTAYLRGIPGCPDQTLASISGALATGQGQIDAPACPAASLVGRAIAGAGAGASPLYVQTGRVYLAGPYKGAPLSLAVVTPAVAGPFDLGSVVIRTAVHVDPVNAQIRAVSDPIPTILHGIPLNVRDIRVSIDRPGFTLNPTSCEEKSVSAKITGTAQSSADLSNRFQVGECAALAFKPQTSIQLFGGIHRAKYQGVRAVVRPRPGDANIAGATVRFPSSAFVAQEHLQNICTRVQWAADACPKSSVYGVAEAISPLLDEPLKGKLHLRSSNNLLPDLVADLRGPEHQPIRVEVAVRNDSVKGALRNTVTTAPDAPVTYFRMQVFGGKKALIVNSRNICKDRNAARVSMRAHNGRSSVQSVPVRNAKCGKWRKAQKRKAAQRKRAAAAKRSAAARRP